MLGEFKPLRFFVMMAVAAFVVCGVTAFYTHRAVHGRTPEERAAYWIGEKAGEQAPRDAKLPTPAELNMMAQKDFDQQGSGNKQDWDLAFERRVRGRVQENASPLKISCCQRQAQISEGANVVGRQCLKLATGLFGPQSTRSARSEKERRPQIPLSRLAQID